MTSGLAALALVGVLLALPGAIVAIHYTVLGFASLLYRERRATVKDPLRFLVLIPAHNEEAVLGRTLAAVDEARRPDDLVLVVDDRSTDQTGAIARQYGAIVLRRTPDQVPGRAAARQAGIRLALTLEWDAIAMVDADSIVEPGYFEACEAVLASGANAVQARSESLIVGGVLAHATVAAFALQGITIPRGRDRLGLSVRLKGTGMVLARGLVGHHPFRGPGAGEDLWLSNDLLMDGVVARHVDSARLRSQPTRSMRIGAGQRARWEAGRMMAAREFVLPLLRRRSMPALEAALHLVTVPFALAILSLVVGASVLAVGGARAAATIAVALLVGLAIDLVIGMLQARAPAATWLALLTAPAYVLFKVWVHARAIVAVIRDDSGFAATPRE